MVSFLKPQSPKGKCLCCLLARLCPTLQPRGLQPAKLLCLWDFPGKNTGMGCHFLLQGNFLTQGWNLHLLHWQKILFNIEAPGKPQNASTHTAFLHAYIELSCSPKLL